MYDYIIWSWFFIVLVTGMVGIISCTSQTDLEDGTPAMVARLDSISKNINTQVNEYANNARLEYFKKVPPPFDLVPKINYHLMLAQELLRAGDTEAAIERYQYLLEVWNELDPNQKSQTVDFKRSVEESLALSYLRLGEQQNCLLNHSSASCLFPIRGNGVHTITEGSEKAIEIYQKLIPEYKAANNKDYALMSQWLLNIAYMTLGRYPDDVPEQYLIPQAAIQSDYDVPYFNEIAMNVGLAEQMGLDQQGLSGGSITEDFNRDGFIDVVTSSWGLDDQLHYYENDGKGSFINKTEEAGLTGIVGGINLRHADFNNDGYADILVLRGAWIQTAGHHPNSLLMNNRNGTFSDVTVSAGLFSLHPTQTAEWGDFNNDGWLDLFIGNETNGSDNNPCELYLSQGDGTFNEIASAAGIDVTGYIKGIAIGDVNNDGWQDLYISRYGEPNILFRNEKSNSFIPTFTDITQSAGVADPIVSFPTWFWDFNNDGWQDLFVSAYDALPGDVALEYLGKEPRRGIPRLYKNNRDGTFTDVTSETNLDKVMLTMGSNFGDFDNDGYLDFYVGTGDPDFRSLMPNRMFRNNSGERFQEVTEAGGFGHLQKGHGVSFADLDNDGDQDIFTVIGGAFEGDGYMNALFENPGGYTNNWITLLFEGTKSNYYGYGNRIIITVDTPVGERKIYRTVSNGSSFGSNSLQLEIGLGDANNIKSIEVYWPASGAHQVFTDVPFNRYYKITENEDQLKILLRKKIELGTESM